MYKLSKSFVFSAAHYLEGYRGECGNLHGHNWKVVVCIKGEVLDAIGILVDFKVIKELVKNAVMNRLDHKYLNQCIPANPTAENISEWIFGQLSDELKKNEDFNKRGIEVESIVVYEGDDSCCEFVL